MRCQKIVLNIKYQIKEEKTDKKSSKFTILSILTHLRQEKEKETIPSMFEP